MGLSRHLAEWITNTDYEDLPEEVVEFTKLCILDWLGSAIAGKDQPPVQMLRQVVEEMGGTPQSHLVTGAMSSVLHSALVNAAASHVVELDDIHKGSIIHAATVVIPAALSVAEWQQCSGKELITAIAVGYEICYRIGEAVSPSHYYYWHNTATCGTFGAAAATAKLLHLSEEEIIHTLGSAGTQAAGLWEFIVDGAMSKQLHPAKAAYNGILSGLLASKGFTAAQHILEGDRGFFKAMATQYDTQKVTTGLGKTFKIMENSFKIHASCRHTHSAIDLVLHLAKTHHIQPEHVQAIRVGTYETALTITDNTNPDTIYASKFSLQFCTALALVHGNASLLDFNEESLHDPVIRDVMKRVNVAVEPRIDESYPVKWGAIVEIELVNGNRYFKQSEYPKGDPEHPASVDEIKEKFRLLTSTVLQEQTDDRMDTILNLEKAGEVCFLMIVK